LKEYSTTTELGLYSFGYKFGDLVYSILINTFFLAWNPLRWDIYEMPDGKVIFARFNKLLFIALPFLSMIIMSFSLLLSGMLTADKEYLKGLQIIYYIGFSHVLYGMYYFNTMGMLFTNKTGKISQIVLISGAVNILLNFLLIPKLGMTGAAISTLIGYLLMFLISRSFSQKYYPIERHIFFEVTQVMIIFCLVIVMTYLAKVLSNVYLLAMLTFLIAFLIPVVNFLFKNISLKEILQVKEYIISAKRMVVKRKSQL
jgi:O-antigen/teichoic acid export membrane protein